MTNRCLPVLILVTTILPLGVSYAGADLLKWSPTSDAAAYGKSQVSLIQAIAVAKRKSAGRAIHADFQLRADKGIFEVEILKTNKLTLVTIDAQTDKIIGSTAVGTINELSGDQRNAIAATATAKLKLEDAAAQGDELGDWAVDAGVEMIGGKSAYRVDILKDAKLGTVAIDPDSGKVMQ